MAQRSNLVIVESPSKAKTIGKYLGPEYTVKASMGHLRDLPKSTMGVDIENGFEPEYIPMESKAEIISASSFQHSLMRQKCQRICTYYITYLINIMA